MTVILEGLNAAQCDAVTSPASVLQVLAPPGSGKTKTLTSRVAYLLTSHDIAPWDIICCTFTIKASREMRERLKGMIGQKRESKLILGTFHSVCVRYLRIYGYLIGIENFGVADSSDSLAIIKRIVKKHKLTLDARGARARIAHRKARGRREEKTTTTQRKSVEDQEFATIFQAYEDALQASNLLDYDDLLLRCCHLLRLQPNCVSNVEVVLIDEFQDTNVVQFELMKLFASKRRRITIVGDPDQSIYGFRSAESANLVRMRMVYPGTVVINLEENYRSSAAILKAAQDVIEQDTQRHDKELRATHGYGTLPALRTLSSAHEEASWIVHEIRRAMAMTGKLLNYSDFAILLRAAHLSRSIESGLGKSGIPFRMIGGARFFDREEIKILLNYLRTISQPTNTAALSVIINVPSRKIGEEKTTELIRLADDTKVPVWDVIRGVLKGTVKLGKSLSKPVAQRLTDFVGIIEDARAMMPDMAPDNVPKELLVFIIEKLSFQKFLQTKHPEDHENRWANVEELLSTAADIVHHQTLSVDTNFDESLPVIEGLVQQKCDAREEVLARFLASITLSADLESSEVDEEQQQCLTISTIHAAKGLEWPVVFVPAVYEGSIPHSRAEDTDEERRLLYVAMTRAQALLYLSRPLRQARDNVEAEQSRFLGPRLRTSFSKVGPEFSDNIVAGIAKTLRRACPSQKDIVDGIQSLTTRESTRDDMWPEDGSPLPRQYWNDSLTLPNIDESKSKQNIANVGQSKAQLQGRGQDGPAGQTSYQPSTTSFALTTMGQHRTYSISSATLGFTKASDHLKPYPPQPESTLTESLQCNQLDTLPVANSQGKRGADSSQGKLTAFFARGRALNLDTSAESKSSLPSLQRSATEPALPPPPLVQMPPKIPQELSSHKLPSKTLPHKRPRPVLEETVNPQWKRHPCFSSSPTRDVEPSSLKADQVSAQLSCKDQTGSVDLAKVVNLDHSQKKKTSYTTVASTTSTRPAATLHTTSMAMMQQTGPTRRTLGVRRTMNGWENRRNK